METVMVLELTAEFDPFLAKHIKIRIPGKGKTSYLQLLKMLPPS
jgi:hypothetical protein